MNYDGGHLERCGGEACMVLQAIYGFSFGLVGFFTYPNTSKLKVRKILVFFTSLQL
jgi:hypothetical protein